MTTKPLTTTFAICHGAGACVESYKKISKALGGIKKHGRNTPIPMIKLLDILGFEDALWVLDNGCAGLRSLNVARLFAADCAEHVLHIFEKACPNDARPRLAIATARDFAKGKIHDDDRYTACSGAREAASRARLEAWGAASAARWAVGDGGNAAYVAYLARTAIKEDAAGNVEREWQVRRLLRYLKGTMR